MQEQKEVLTTDSWLGRALAKMPAPTGKALDGWERFEPRMKGFRYRRELEDGRSLYVVGGPRKGWEWTVYPPHNGQPRYPTVRGYAEHLDYAMMGAEQAETLPKVIVLAGTHPLEYSPQAWEIAYSGSLTEGSSQIVAKHLRARQAYGICFLGGSLSEPTSYCAHYIPEMSMFFPVKDHSLVLELGREAIWAFLYAANVTDEDDEFCGGDGDPNKEKTRPPRLQ